MITSLITVLSLVFWIMAVSALEKEKDDRVTEIEGLFNQASSLAGEPRVPNDKVAGEMDKLISQRQEEIRVAWQVKYDQQNSEETGSSPGRNSIRVLSVRSPPCGRSKNYHTLSRRETTDD